MSMRVSRSPKGFAVVVAACTTVPALGQGMPDWFNMTTGRGFRKDLPDFFQHQYNGDVNGWQADGGWCRPTSLANCLYSYKVNGYPNLLPNSGNINVAGMWQVPACIAIVNLRDVQGAGVQMYLDDRGYPQTGQPNAGLKFTQYFVNQVNGNVTYKSSDGAEKRARGTAFDLYKKELKDGQDVLVRWAADTSLPGANFNRGLWWRGPDVDGGNYHYVTGAGFDCGTAEDPKRVIYFADPDSNKGSNDADAGWNGRANDAGVNGRKYGPADVAVPVPARGPNMNDDPVNFAQFYGCASFAADGYTVDDVAMNMRYRNVKIRSIETICPVKAVVKESTPTPTPTEPDRTRTRMVCTGGPISFIDGVLLYPAFAPIIPFSITPSPTTQFQDPSGGLWFGQFIPPSLPDPDGNLRPFGGHYFFSPDGALTPGEIATMTVFTHGPFVGFDVMLHVAGTPPWELGTWLVQPINNGPESLYVDQSVFCIADFNGVGGVTVQDIFDFLAAYFGGDADADVNNSGSVTVQDIFDFLSEYFMGCPA